MRGGDSDRSGQLEVDVRGPSFLPKPQSNETPSPAPASLLHGAKPGVG